jgi:spore coat polysaccharide biosynthesis protein SpsF
MKIVAVTQARLGSTRLPAKILRTIGGQTILELHLQRLKQSRLITQFVLATTNLPQDLVFKEIADKQNFIFFTGSESDVLSRFFHATTPLQPDYVVRITADCPLIDAALVDKVIQFTIDSNLDYASNTLVEEFPDGQDVEVFNFLALEKAFHEAVLVSEREHVTPYIKKNSTFNAGSLFKSAQFTSDVNYHKVRMTVDEEADFELIKLLVEKLGTDKSWLEYTNYILENNIQINTDIIRNEGYLKSLKNDNK